VVNIVDLMTQFPRYFHPYGMNETEFVELLAASKPVIFAFYGYQRAVHQLLHGRVNAELQASIAQAVQYSKDYLEDLPEVAN
jgi:xylulose-5-phosphate/fructose-6-phosphate phosphoketolase